MEIHRIRWDQLGYHGYHAIIYYPFAIKNMAISNPQLDDFPISNLHYFKTLRFVINLTANLYSRASQTLGSK